MAGFHKNLLTKTQSLVLYEVAINGLKEGNGQQTVTGGTWLLMSWCKSIWRLIVPQSFINIQRMFKLGSLNHSSKFFVVLLVQTEFFL